MVRVAESRRDEILRWLDEVKDPEVPVLSIRETISTGAGNCWSVSLVA